MLNVSAMKKRDAIAFFKTHGAVAKAAGISVSAVSQWGDVIPLGTAALLEKVSNGRLVLRLEDYRRRSAPDVFGPSPERNTHRHSHPADAGVSPAFELDLVRGS